MIKLELEGNLQSLEYPEEIEVSTPFEALIFLAETIPGFRKEFITGKYLLIVDGCNLVDDQGLQACGFKSLKITPVIDGAWEQIVIVAVSMLISYALMPSVSSYEEREESDSRQSFIFKGAKNTVEQGIARPVLYGEYEVGGHIISTGITTEHIS